MNVTVQGRRLPAAEDITEVVGPGNWQFSTIDAEPTDEPLAAADPDGDLSFTWGCPRTGKPCGGIIIGVGHKPAVSPSWQWDGNADAPTLTPSINCTGGCGWHGWLTTGVFKGC